MKYTYGTIWLMNKMNEELKAKDQMEWVRCMNNIKNRAEEIVLKELVYV